jgi:hypothetical protein
VWRCGHCGKGTLGEPEGPPEHRCFASGGCLGLAPAWEVASQEEANAVFVQAIGDTELYSLKDVTGS